MQVERTLTDAQLLDINLENMAALDLADRKGLLVLVLAAR